MEETKKENRVVKFVKDHKVGLALLGGAALGGLGVIGYDKFKWRKLPYTIHTNDKDVYDMICKDVRAWKGLAFRIKPIALKDLGEWGKALIDDKHSEDFELTHILGFVQDTEK